MTEQRVGRLPAEVDGEAAIDLEGLTQEVLPALIARLRVSRLAELEVRSDGWRVRLRRDPRAPKRSARGHVGDRLPDDAPERDPAGEARSPAVGYFSPVRGLIVGQVVAAGDSLGSVDVLGIAQEVTAPLDGVVSAILAEAGQAVEYGQVLAEIDPLASEQASGSSDDRADREVLPGPDPTEVRS